MTCFPSKILRFFFCKTKITEKKFDPEKRKNIPNQGLKTERKQRLPVDFYFI